MLLIVIALLLLAGAAVTLYAACAAPDGFEDQTGFHAIADDSAAPSEDARQTRLPGAVASH